MQIKYFKLEKMKMLLLFVLLLISSEFSFGQKTAGVRSINYKLESPEFVPHKRMKLPKRTSLYLELGGSGGFGSFNFEWNFMTRNKFR